MLKGRKILLGVSSSIAAYKAAHLVRLLVKQQAEVQVLMTPASHSFITPLTLATLSKKPVLTNFVANDSGEWNNHVELGLWADVMLIAPATANTIAAMANGLCNNLVLATYLSARCPVMFAPAMDLDMYAHPSTQQNINTLISRNNILIDAEDGELESGLNGFGRMAEPENIVAFLEKHFETNNELKGVKAIVTAGPTYEYIDPVRFIGNASSGKMGYAIAENLANRGAEVTLVSGPVHITTSHKNISVVKVTSAQQMFDATTTQFSSANIAVCVAAVADYTPANTASQKIKKKDAQLNIELKPTPDTLAYLGSKKTNKQLLVGFALETENEIENAKAKLAKKNCDILVLNSLNDTGAGFNTDTNKITLIDKHNNLDVFALKSKQNVANDICNKIVQQFKLL
jgi:phosphopantothenoylcysteine decarboxylase / phosphopantothenate---cysteine ligase